MILYIDCFKILISFLIISADFSFPFLSFVIIEIIIFSFLRFTAVLEIFKRAVSLTCSSLMRKKSVIELNPRSSALVFIFPIVYFDISVNLKILLYLSLLGRPGN
jgi:hypothetical protein